MDECENQQQSDTKWLSSKLDCCEVYEEFKNTIPSKLILYLYTE